MKLKKGEFAFAAASVVILAATLIYTFAGARSVGPMVDYHEFPIIVTYEEYGETKTREVVYCAYYHESSASWSAYYEDSGMEYITPMETYSNGEWSFVLQLDAGYLMGDPAYADVYADGFPEPTITYYDDAWNEYSNVTEVESIGIKLIGCEYPEPIENGFVDTGVELDHVAVAVLTLMCGLVLALGLLLVKKEEDVVYQSWDKTARSCNFLVAATMLPLLFALGPEWDLIPDGSFDSVLAALLAPITVLGICASILLRRKGKTKAGAAVQFVGPVLFLYLCFVHIMIGFGYYCLFVPAGVIAGVLIAVCSKPAEDVVPTRLDQTSVVLNILLIPIYFFVSIPSMFFGVLIHPYSDCGIVQAIIATLLACMAAAAPLYCGIALGISAALRKKGRSRAGFLVQFAGFAGIAFTFLVVAVCEVIPWISASIN